VDAGTARGHEHLPVPQQRLEDDLLGHQDRCHVRHQQLQQANSISTSSSKLSVAGAGALHISGSGSFPAPDYQAVNADGNTGLQLTNLPVSLVGTTGMIYVTEIYTKHALITPFDRFGFKLPETLYSIAYF
jgi:hypothetical protein